MKPLHLETPFAQYQSHRLIGQGGAGKVYEARSNGVDEDVVAIKVLDPATATRERLSRFKNEILFGVRAKHSGIVPVLDSGLALVDGANVPFYVMPLYPATLRDVLKREANGTRLLALFVSLLDGVEAAHLLGVVHRDLKPENIFLSTNEERLVVGGFGIARFTAEALYTAVETRPGARLANFQYAAPEQRARGKTIDQRADL